MQTDKNNGIYQDLGNIIPTSTVSASTTEYSNWFDNYAWVRRLLLKIRANGAHDIILQRKNSNGVVDWGYSVAGTATGTLFEFVELSAVVGYSFRIGIKNNEAGNLEVEGHGEVFR